MVSLSEALVRGVARGFNEPGHAVHEVPTVGLGLRVVHVVDIVPHFGPQIEVFFIPGQVVPSLQILARRRLVPVVGQAVRPRPEPGRVFQPVNVPDSVGEGQGLPLGQVSVDKGRTFQEGRSDPGRLMPLGGRNSSSQHEGGEKCESRYHRLFTS